MEAANNGRYDLVKRLISKGADVNAKSVAKNTALHFAALSGHAKVCSLLIRNGANIEDVNDSGHTPLMEAASAGHVAVAEVLLNHGAGVNAHSNEFKESALTLACYKGHLEMVEFLLKRGADKQHKTDEMHTALMEACMDGHVEVARLLLDHDVDVNMPPDSFESPLTLAACGGHVELVSLLIQRGANLEEINDEGYTPLMEAAREGHNAVVQILLRNGANVNATTEETQETALSLACCGGSLDVVRLLIEEGANPNLGGTTPLMEAAQEGQLSVVKYLLKHGADIDIVSYNGDTALALACEAGHIDIAQLLIASGADVNKADTEHGRTALMRASRAGHLNIILLLLANGANVNQPTTSNDHTALSLACAAGHVHVARTLIKHGAQVAQKLQDNSNCLIEAARGGHAQVINMLLKYLKDSPIEDETGSDNLRSSNRLMVEGQMGTKGSRKLSPTEDEARNSTKETLDKDEFQGNDGSSICSSHTVDLATDDKPESKGSNKPPDIKHPRDILSGSNNNGNILQAPGSEDSSSLTNSSGTSERDVQIECSSPLCSRQLHQRQDLNAATSAKLECDRCHHAALQQRIATRCQHHTGATRVGQDVSDQDESSGGVRKCRHFVVGHVPAEMPLCTALSSALPATVQRVSQNLLGDAEPSGPPDCCTHLHSFIGGCDRDDHFINQMSIDSCTDGNGDTPLTFACMGGFEDSVLVLLSEGADLEHKDKKGHTPLMVSCTAGHLGIVQILVAHGADLEATVDKTRDTCLSLSASAGQTEIVTYLLNAGANKEHRNASDYTPLCLAASGGFVETINVLLGAGAEINSRTNSKLGISPLMLAAMNGHLPATKLLLDLGADINAQIETNKNTALTLACYQGRCEVVSLLIERKANIEHRAKTGLTPLMEAASGGFSDVGAILIAKGADVNAAPVPSSRDTPLTIAADKGHDKFIQLLLDNNAYIDAKNKKSATALWLAASGGHFDAVQTLISRGANPDIEDARRISVLMAAFKRGHVKIVKFLVRHVRQFPSDTDCLKFISSCTDKELQKRCKICMEVIMAAKDRQTQEADKAASNLLEELDLERFREESKRQAAAKKREKKKLKRQKRKQQQASLSSVLSDMSSAAVSSFAHSYINEHVDDLCAAVDAGALSNAQRLLSRDLLPDSPAEPNEAYTAALTDDRDVNNDKRPEKQSELASNVVNRKSRRRKRWNISREQLQDQTPRSQSSSFPHSSEQKEERRNEEASPSGTQAGNAASTQSGLNKNRSTTAKLSTARTTENTDSGDKSSADEWTEVVGSVSRQKKPQKMSPASAAIESPACAVAQPSTTGVLTTTTRRQQNAASSSHLAKSVNDVDSRRSNGNLNWMPRTSDAGVVQSRGVATAPQTIESTTMPASKPEEHRLPPTQRSLSSGRSQHNQGVVHSLSFAPSALATATSESRLHPTVPVYFTADSATGSKTHSSRKSPIGNNMSSQSSTFSSRRNAASAVGKPPQRASREDNGSSFAEKITSRATGAPAAFQMGQQQRNARAGQSKAWKSLVYTPCSTSKLSSTLSSSGNYRSAELLGGKTNSASTQVVAPPISDLEVFPELGADIKGRAGRGSSRPRAASHQAASDSSHLRRSDNKQSGSTTEVAAIPTGISNASASDEQSSASTTTLCSKPEQNLATGDYGGALSVKPFSCEPDTSSSSMHSSEKNSSVVCMDKSAMENDNRLELEGRVGHRASSADFSKFLGTGPSTEFDSGTIDSPRFLESRTFINKYQKLRLKSCQQTDEQEKANQDVEYTPFGHSTPFQQWSIGNEKPLDKQKEPGESRDDSLWTQNVTAGKDVSDENVEFTTIESEKFNKAPGHKSAMLTTGLPVSDIPTCVDGLSQLISKEPGAGRPKPTGDMGYKFDTSRSVNSVPDPLRKRGDSESAFVSAYYNPDNQVMPGVNRQPSPGVVVQPTLVNARHLRSVINKSPDPSSLAYNQVADGSRSQSSLHQIPLDASECMKSSSLHNVRPSEKEPDWQALMNMHISSQNRTGTFEDEARARQMFVDTSAEKIASNLDYLRNTKQPPTNLSLLGTSQLPPASNLPMGQCANRNLPAPNRLLSPGDTTCVNQPTSMFRPGWVSPRQQAFNHPTDMMVPPGLHIPYGMPLTEPSIDNPPGDHNPSMQRNIRDPNASCLDLRRQIAEFCGPFLAPQADHQGNLCAAPPAGNRMEYGIHPGVQLPGYRGTMASALGTDEFERQFADSMSSLQRKQKQQAEEMYFMSGQEKFRQNAAAFQHPSVFGWNPPNMAAAGPQMVPGGPINPPIDSQGGTSGTICVPPNAVPRSFPGNQLFSNPGQSMAPQPVPQSGFQLLPSANVPSLNNLIKCQERIRQASAMSSPSIKPQDQHIDLEKLWQQPTPSGMSNPAQILQSLSDDDRRRLYQQLQMRQFSNMQDRDCAALCNKLGHCFNASSAVPPLGGFTGGNQWQTGGTCPPGNASPSSVLYAPIGSRGTSGLPSEQYGRSPMDFGPMTPGGEPLLRPGEAAQNQIMDSMMLMLMMQEQQKQFLQRAAIPTGNRISPPTPQMMAFNSQRPTTSVQFSSNFVNPSNTGMHSAGNIPAVQPRNYNSPILSPSAQFVYPPNIKPSHSTNNLSQFNKSAPEKPSVEPSLADRMSEAAESSVVDSTDDLSSDAAIVDAASNAEFSSAVDDQTAMPNTIGPIGCERKKQVDAGQGKPGSDDWRGLN